MNSPERTLHFRAKVLPSNVDGEWNPNSGNGTLQTITLNSDMLSTASKEFILVTMYHEALHAYLYLEEQRLGAGQFAILYPEWSEYNLNGRPKYKTTHAQFSSFIDDLADAIQSFNSNISRYDAEVLAKMGIINDMSNFDKIINDNYRNGNFGTPCTN